MDAAGGAPEEAGCCATLGCGASGKLFCDPAELACEAGAADGVAAAGPWACRSGPRTVSRMKTAMTLPMRKRLSPRWSFPRSGPGGFFDPCSNYPCPFEPLQRLLVAMFQYQGFGAKQDSGVPFPIDRAAAHSGCLPLPRQFVSLSEFRMERCPSGLRSTLGKRVLGKLNRGFESHPLRHSVRFSGLEPSIIQILRDLQTKTGYGGASNPPESSGAQY